MTSFCFNDDKNNIYQNYVTVTFYERLNNKHIKSKPGTYILIYPNLNTDIDIYQTTDVLWCLYDDNGLNMRYIKQ
jgi:uncharacterized protein with WD repeat